MHCSTARFPLFKVNNVRKISKVWYHFDTRPRILMETFRIRENEQRKIYVFIAVFMHDMGQIMVLILDGKSAISAHLRKILRIESI